MVNSFLNSKVILGCMFDLQKPKKDLAYLIVNNIRTAKAFFFKKYYLKLN